MIIPPAGTALFEFVTVSALRAAQLMRGCTPTVAVSTRPTATAQREVAAGRIRAVARAAAGRNGPHIIPDLEPLLARVKQDQRA